MGEKEHILSLLPESLDRIKLTQMADKAHEALDGEFLVYKQEVWSNAWDNEIGFGIPLTDCKARKSAFCYCTNCGEHWHSGWREGGKLLMAEGEDGMLYPGIPGDADICREFDVHEELECPYCGEKIRTVRKPSISHGRTYNILVGELVNLEQYSTVLFWMITRKVDFEGFSRFRASPWAAIVIGVGGKIWRFHHTDMGMWGKRKPGRAWTEQPRMGEPIRQRYYSWGGFNNTCQGGYYMMDIPDMGGTTGEKTGIAAYLRGGGEYPLAFLLRQKRWKGLEALAMAGWVYTIDSAIHEELSVGYRAGKLLGEAFDLSKRKPKQMLGMSREEMERKAGAQWRWQDAAAFRKCGLTLADFEYVCKCGGITQTATAIERFGATETLKICRYLQKSLRSLQYYMDYLDMLRAIGGGDTHIERYPPNLEQAHDRVSAAKKIVEDSRKDNEFLALADKWKGLEWSDGVICAVLPRSQRDLTAEGNTLQHCVGSYGDAHLSGRLIVFIRHSRRPERSWFTLNINTNGLVYEEIQLHGYKNERKGGKKLYIPAEVRQFVDRWEKEILAPEMKRVKKQEKGEPQKWKTA